MTYYDWLRKNGVPTSVDTAGLFVEESFDEYVANNQKKWVHDRSKTVGASEAFSCIRKSWFSKSDHKYERDDDYEERWGATRRGDLIENHHVEPAIREGLERRGMTLELSGGEQATIVHGNSSATLDGLIVGAPATLLSEYGVEDIGADCVVLEIKSVDPRTHLKGPKPNHEGQVQMQMGMIRETTDYRPNYAIIIYVDASWLDEINVFVVPFDEQVYELGKARADAVFESRDAAELPPEGKLDGLCDYCEWRGTCSEVTQKRVPPPRKALTKTETVKQDQTLIEALDEPVSRAAQLKAEIDAAKRELEIVNEVIRQHLIAAHQSRAVGSDWKVTYTAQSGRATISKSRLEEAGLNPADFMVQGHGFEKLTITKQ